jgi:hypothetical protein
MTARDFHYEDCAIRVAAPDASIVAWLAEFLAPAFAVRDPVADVEELVSLQIDAAEFDRMYDRGPSPDGRVAGCFMFDRGLVELPLWNGAEDGELVVLDRQLGAFYRRDRTRGRTHVVARAAVGSTRVAVMRVVRELVMVHLQRAGWMLVHAAGFIVDDGAVIVAGPKRAGKTTLLMHALESGRARFIANDRLAIRVGSDGAVVRGMPTIVSVRVSTTPRFPDLDARLLRSRYDYRRTLEETRRDGLAAPRAPAEAWSLTPIQFCDVFGAAAGIRATAAAIVFPRFLTQRHQITVHELAKPDARAALAAALFPPHDATALFMSDSTVPGAVGPMARTTTESLLAATSTYVCDLGAGPTADHAWLSQVCEAMIPSPVTRR